MMKNLDELDICIPVVTAIIERSRLGQVEVLVQTRWQPEADPKYSGTIEIPSGWIERYENVYDALRREVFEETGLSVQKIRPELKTRIHSGVDDGAFAFSPFCCHQQIENGLPWIGFVFICEVDDADPRAQPDETKDVRWMAKSELKRIFDEEPESIFTFQMGVLDLYFNNFDQYY